MTISSPPSRPQPPKQMAKALQRSEHDEQKDLFAWAALMRAGYPSLSVMFAVPNGARTSISVAKRLKAEGLRAGVPDVVLPVPRGPWHGLFVEMKRAGGHPSDVTPEQREWHRALEDHDFYVTVAFGFDDAKKQILNYLNLP